VLGYSRTNKTASRVATVVETATEVVALESRSMTGMWGIREANKSEMNMTVAAKSAIRWARRLGTRLASFAALCMPTSLEVRAMSTLPPLWPWTLPFSLISTFAAIVPSV